MKILNVVPITIYNGEVSLGPLYVSSSLKQLGFQSFVYFPNIYVIFDLSRNKYKWLINQLKSVVEEVRPDIVTFSTLSTNIRIAEVMAKFLKETFNLHVVFGGIHCLIEGEKVIQKDYVDAICLGEGEFSLPEYIRSLINNELTETNNLNIMYKMNGNIIGAQKETRFLELDEYPIPDRESLKPYYDHGVLEVANFITGRGCPYKCSYCNAVMLNKRKGYLRFRDAGCVVEEIFEIKKKYNIKKVIFSDETFTLNKEHLFDLLQLYRKRIELPFICQSRVECINEEVAKELSNSRCESITLGIESGNEHIRKEYLNRRMKNEQILRAFHILQRSNIKTDSFNMIGLPQETRKTIWEGVDLNKKARVDHAVCTVFMPFKGTEIYEWYETNNIIIDEPDINYYDRIIIRHPNVSRHFLLFCAHRFDHFIKMGASGFNRKNYNIIVLLKFYFIFYLKKAIVELIRRSLWISGRTNCGKKVYFLGHVLRLPCKIKRINSALKRRFSFEIGLRE